MVPFRPTPYSDDKRLSALGELLPSALIRREPGWLKLRKRDHIQNSC